MLNDEIMDRLNHLKSNVQYYWGKLSENDFEMAREKISHLTDKVQKKVIGMKDYEGTTSENLEMDDLPLTLNKDEGPGVHAHSAGIDSFGEEDTFNPEDIDDHQDFRNRKQNSDLSSRFYTHGLH